MSSRKRARQESENSKSKRQTKKKKTTESEEIQDENEFLNMGTSKSGEKEKKNGKTKKSDKKSNEKDKKSTEKEKLKKISLESPEIANMTIREILRNTTGGKKTKAQLQREAEKQKLRDSKKNDKTEINEVVSEMANDIELDFLNDGAEINTNDFEDLDKAFDENQNYEEEYEEQIPEDIPEEVPIIEPTKTQPEEPKGSGPRMKVIDGKIVYDKESLTLLNEQEEIKLREVRDNGRRSAKFKRQVDKWTDEETDLFYKVIRQCGSDFSLIEIMFPGRTRKQIKNKFKKEEKENPKRIDFAFRNPLPLDLEHFKKLSGLNIDREQLEATMEELNAPITINEPTNEKTSETTEKAVENTEKEEIVETVIEESIPEIININTEEENAMEELAEEWKNIDDEKKEVDKELINSEEGISFSII